MSGVPDSIAAMSAAVESLANSAKAVENIAPSVAIAVATKVEHMSQLVAALMWGAVVQVSVPDEPADDEVPPGTTIN